MNNRYKITYYPSALTRQHSYLSLHNFSNNTTKDFHYLSTLGEGTYGYVRLFAHEDEKIAVKSFKVKHSTNLDKKTVAQNKREIISEYHFLQRAHQYGECYSLQHFEEALPLSKRNIKRNSRLYNYTYRMTMPYIEGMNPGKFATTYITNPKDMATLVLRIAEELHRTHLTGIVHGDFGDRNILVSGTLEEYTVKGIDFGLACDINKFTETGFEHDDHAGSSIDMADEKLSLKKLKAHPSQDIFSFGKVVGKLIRKMGDDWEADFMKLYPDIMHFIKRAANKNAEKRPNLADFIQTLQAKVDWTRDLPDPLRELINALQTGSSSDVRRLTESKSGQFTLNKLHELLLVMLVNQEYLLAGRLLNVRKKIPLTDIQPRYQAALKLFCFIDQLDQHDVSINRNSLFANQSDHKAFEASSYLGNLIEKQQDIDYASEAYLQHQDAIQRHPELNIIYNDLIANSLLRAEPGFFHAISRMFSN